MFNWIYKQIEDSIIDLIDKRIERLKEDVGGPKTKCYSSFFMHPYDCEATGLYKEIERIHEYLGVELVKTEASEKLVAKKKK